MKKILCFLCGLAVVLGLSLAVVIPAMAAGNTYYVATTGLDTNNGSSGSPWLTIQHAVNIATNGDTINVAAGTYPEQLLIQKSLTIIGVGEATTIIQAPATRTGSVTQVASDTIIHDYLVAAYASSGTIDVRIQGFTLDLNGRNKTAGTGQIDGVFFRDVKDAGGTVAGLFSCTIHNFAATPDYEGFGVVVYGDSLLTLNDNDISDYTRDGISINRHNGSGPDPNVTINANTVTGSATPLNAISIDTVTAGAVTNNTVTGHTRSAPWAAGGIVLWGSTGVPVTGNYVNGNFYGIDLEPGTHDVTVSGNVLNNNIKRAISLNDADNNTVSGNTINGPAGGTDDVGIGLANTSTGNMIGGATPAAGNSITMATTGSANLYAIYMQADVAAGSNTIRYNTITGGQRAVQFDGPPGITGTTTVSNNTISGQSFGAICAYNNGSLVITNNTLTNTVRPMEFFGPVNVTITGNVINGATFDAINMGNVSGTKLISGNTISNSAQNAIHGQAAADNLDINGNTISTSQTGIYIDTGCTGVTITNNTIFNNTYSGINAYTALTTVTGNSINNCWRGIETNSVLTANNNILTNNEYGSVIFLSNDAHNVTNNWWGSASGPEAWLSSANLNTFNQSSQGSYIQANTFANFTFAPWLSSGTDSNPGAVGFQPAAGSSFAPVTNGANGYASIQAAINAATAGNTINAGAGTYTEQLVINKNLTITGAGRGSTTIQAPAVLANDPDGAKDIVLITGSITVEFSGFTVQGPVNGLNFGIYVRDGATANIHDNTIKDIRDAPLSGNQTGIAIEVGKYPDTAPVVSQIGTATITNNIIFGYQKTGIECEGSGSSATITGNTVTGAGLITTTSQNGIQIRRGATGSITNNVVTGNAYSGHEVNATGIVVTYPGNGVIIAGNTVHHNTANIYTYEADGVQILNNQVSDAADGRIVAGITADADNVATASVGISVTITGNMVRNNLSGGSHQGPGIFLWGVKSGTVSGNTITGSGDDGILIGASGNITITNNLFSGNGYAPYPGGPGPSPSYPYSLIVGPDPNAAAIDFGGVVPELESFGLQPNTLGGFSVHNNSFVGNRNGIWNYDTGSVNATNNFWGTSNAAAIASMISGNVNYDPWHLKQKPSAVTKDQVTADSMVLHWTIADVWAGDYYDFRYATTPINTTADWNNARRIVGEPEPVNGAQEMIIRGLSAGTRYYFALAIGYNNAESDSTQTDATTLLVPTPDTTAPGAVTTLGVTAGSPSTTSVVLTWTATGDNGGTGFASRYIIKRSNAPITNANFDAATTVFNSMVPKAGGQIESFTVTNLNPNTRYYFAIKVQDEVPNTSAISNVVNIQTTDILPVVSGITPEPGDNGAARTLTITGTNFLNTGTTLVRLVSDANVINLTNVNVASATSLTARVPAGTAPGVYKSRVVNDNGTSALSAATYTVTAAPTPLPVVTNAIPNMAASNTPVNGVEIFGQNFTGATAVTINGTTATSVTVNSATKVTINVPGLPVGEYDIKVTTPAGTNDISSVKFIVTAPVVINANTTEDVTTSGVVETDGTISVGLTMTTDDSETATRNTDSDAEISVTIQPGTTLTDNSGHAYTGTLNPPRVVKPDPTIQAGLPSTALVIEMGNPDQTINFSQNFVAIVKVTATTTPRIYYYNKDSRRYELAGKAGIKDGITYTSGGKVLSVEGTEYTMGLLLDHMSTFVSSNVPLFDAPSPALPPLPTMIVPPTTTTIAPPTTTTTAPPTTTTTAPPTTTTTAPPTTITTVPPATTTTAPPVPTPPLITATAPPATTTTTPPTTTVATPPTTTTTTPITTATAPQPDVITIDWILGVGIIGVLLIGLIIALFIRRP